jgi:hypothetical protein
VKLDSLKDLDKLLVLCNKRGVKTMKIDNLEFHLEPDLVTPARSTKSQVKETASQLQVPGFADPGTIPNDGWDTLTDEQKLFYSAQGHLPQEQ